MRLTTSQNGEMTHFLMIQKPGYYLIAMHCRGKEFWKSFTSIGGLRALTSAPFMALTASASPVIQSSIIKSLHLTDAALVMLPLDRPNIFISVSKVVGLNVSELDMVHTECYIYTIGIFVDREILPSWPKF